MTEEKKPGLFGRLRDALLNRATKPQKSTGALSVWSPPSKTAGVYVTDQNALMVSTFWAATRYLQQSIAGLPWHAMREIPGGAEIASSHPVDRMLSERVSYETSSYDFRELLVGWAIRAGNGCAEIEPDQIGRPVALHPLHPDRVEFLRSTDTIEDAYGDEIVPGELYYRIDGSTILAARRVFHLKGYGAEGPVGLSVVDFAAQTIGWAKANALFGGNFFAQGANIGGVIQNKLPLSKEALEAQKAEFKSAHTGAAKAFTTLHLDAEATYKPFEANLEQSQFVELNYHLIEEICRWVGVPPSKVFHWKDAHYNNLESASIEVVTDSLLPWCKKLEAEANHKLFGQNRRGHFSRLNLRGILRGAFEDQNKGLEIARRNGVISADEWRSFIDLNPIGKERGGDLHLVQAAQITLERVGENFPANTNTPPAKAA
jgi:HK97 family phage portal protein